MKRLFSFVFAALVLLVATPSIAVPRAPSGDPMQSFPIWIGSPRPTPRKIGAGYGPIPPPGAVDFVPQSQGPGNLAAWVNPNTLAVVTWAGDLAGSTNALQTVVGIEAHSLPPLPLTAGAYALVYTEGTGLYSWTSTSTFTPTVSGSGFGHWTGGVLDAAASHGAANQLVFGGATDITWAAPAGDVSLSGTTLTVTGLQGHGITLAAGFLEWTGAAWSFATGASIFTPGADLAGNGTSTATTQYLSSISYSSAAAGGAVAINGTGTSFVVAANNTGFVFNQATQTSNIATAPLSISTQGAYASAIGANQNPGTLNLDTGAPVGTGQGSIYVGPTHAADIYVGNTSTTGAINLITKGANYSITGEAGGTFLFNLGNGSGDYLWLGAQGSSAAAEYLPTGISFQSGVVSPAVSQSAPASDVATTSLLIQSQGPYALAATNKAPGNINLNTPAPVSGGSYGTVNVQSGGTTRGQLWYDGANFNVSPPSGGMIVGTAATTIYMQPGATNTGVWQAGVLQLFANSPSVGGGLGVLGIANATTAPTSIPAAGVVLYSTSQDLGVAANAIVPYSAGGASVGTAPLYWSALYTQPLAITLVSNTSELTAPSTSIGGILLSFGAAAAAAGGSIQIIAQPPVASGTSNGGAVVLQSGGVNGGTGSDGGIGFQFGGATDQVTFNGANTSALRGTLQWSSGITPKWSQTSLAVHNGDTTDWVWAPQPNTDATSTSGRSGNAIVNVALPPNTSTAEARLVVTRNGTFAAAIGPYETLGANYSAVYLGPGLVPSSANYSFLSGGSNVYLNAPSGNVNFSSAGTSYMTMTTAALQPTSAGGLTIGTPTLPWGDAYSGGLSITTGGTGGLGGNATTPSSFQYASTSSIAIPAGSGATSYLTAAEMATPYLKFASGASNTGTANVYLHTNGGSVNIGTAWIVDTTLVTGLGTNTIVLKIGTASRTVTIGAAGLFLVYAAGSGTLYVSNALN